MTSGLTSATVVPSTETEVVSTTRCLLPVPVPVPIPVPVPAPVVFPFDSTPWLMSSFVFIFLFLLQLSFDIISTAMFLGSAIAVTATATVTATGAGAAIGAGVGAVEKHVSVLGNVEDSILFKPINPFRAVSTMKPASVSALIDCIIVQEDEKMSEEKDFK